MGTVAVDEWVFRPMTAVARDRSVIHVNATGYIGHGQHEKESVMANTETTMQPEAGGRYPMIQPEDRSRFPRPASEAGWRSPLRSSIA